MKRRGRPPLPAGQAKTAAFNTRLRPQLHRELTQAAERSGRSLSEEIEWRLNLSVNFGPFLAASKAYQNNRKPADDLAGPVRGYVG